VDAAHVVKRLRRLDLTGDRPNDGEVADLAKLGDDHQTGCPKLELQRELDAVE
jgi:hypothetical protein